VDFVVANAGIELIQLAEINCIFIVKFFVMNLVIRPMQESDNRAATLLLHQLGYSSTEAQMQDRIRNVISSDDHCAYMALKDGQAAGWIHASVSISFETDPFVEIKGLVVSEECRGQGIGKHLVEHVRKWVIQKSIPRIRVRCNRIRHQSHLFYQKIGFTETKEQKVFDMSL
jgi:GNAT superfamily N-acetyltransferase